MLISNYVENYKQSLFSAFKQHTSKNSEMRKHGYAKARSLYETNLIPYINENVQGASSSTPDRENLFKLA